MNNDWVNIVSAVGFPILLVLIGLNFAGKHGPKILAAWHDFTKALDHLSTSVSQNSEVSQKQFDKYVTVEDLLKKAIDMLENHHENAIEIRSDVGDVKGNVDKMQKLITELSEQVQNLKEGA